MTGDLGDIYTEPAGAADTLSHLGPLTPLAGVWEGTGRDQHPQDPKLGPTGEDPFEEHYELQPLDFQTNGPQLLYGLRYHTRLVKPGEIAMFHEQVGFWMWEPAEDRVLLSLTIPRGQVALAAGRCAPDATSFEVRAVRGSTEFGICSNPFLEAAFTTVEFRMTVTVHDDGTWSYDQNTRLVLPDRAEPFDHVDANTLRRVAPPTPNPLAAGQSAGTTPARQPETTRGG
jgi:hypothetical protein